SHARARPRRITLNPTFLEGGWKNALIVSKSAAAVQGDPAGRALLRSQSRLLQNASDTSTKCNSCSTLARFHLDTVPRENRPAPGAQRFPERPNRSREGLCRQPSF